MTIDQYSRGGLEDEVYYILYNIIFHITSGSQIYIMQVIALTTNYDHCDDFFSLTFVQYKTNYSYKSILIMFNRCD